jgi:hypothetical protein
VSAHLARNLLHDADVSTMCNSKDMRFMVVNPGLCRQNRTLGFNR